MLAEENPVQNTRLGNTAARGRPLRNTGNASGSQRGTKDTIVNLRLVHLPKPMLFAHERRLHPQMSLLVHSLFMILM